MDVIFKGFSSLISAKKLSVISIETLPDILKSLLFSTVGILGVKRVSEYKSKCHWFINELRQECQVILALRSRFLDSRIKFLFAICYNQCTTAKKQYRCTIIFSEKWNGLGFLKICHKNCFFLFSDFYQSTYLRLI